MRSTLSRYVIANDILRRRRRLDSYRDQRAGIRYTFGRVDVKLGKMAASDSRRERRRKGKERISGQPKSPYMEDAQEEGDAAQSDKATPGEGMETLR